jgi:DNA-binding NarL/FixJ family response regulator
LIRLLFVDDHALVRAAVVQALAGEDDLQVVAQASGAQEALALADADPTLDVALLDLNLPDAHGVDLVLAMRERHPRLPVVVLSMHDESAIVARALRAGAAGYVTKGSQMPVLVAAIRAVVAGGTYRDPSLDVSHAEAQGLDAEADVALSQRELQVLELIVAGLRLGEIAERLHVSAKTVSTHKMRLMHKLRINNNADLVRFGVEHAARSTP